MTKKTQVIKITAKDENDAKKQTASLCIDQALNAAMIIIQTNKSMEPDFLTIVDELRHKINKVVKGDISPIEKMLMAQAITLESIFTTMLNKSLGSQYLSSVQTYSKIALKAQNQCRQTLAALAEIKNPKRTTFIKNSATNQQVNFNKNSENILKESNELLTESQDAPMDITGAATTSGVNQDMATVEA